MNPEIIAYTYFAIRLLALFVAAGLLAVGVIGLLRVVKDAIERHRRGTIVSPYGNLHPPTNRELRRARKEFQRGNKTENHQNH